MENQHKRTIKKIDFLFHKKLYKKQKITRRSVDKKLSEIEEETLYSERNKQKTMLK
jgi:hypothetical protein